MIQKSPLFPTKKESISLLIFWLFSTILSVKAIAQIPKKKDHPLQSRQKKKITNKENLEIINKKNIKNNTQQKKKIRKNPPNRREKKLVQNKKKNKEKNEQKANNHQKYRRKLRQHYRIFLLTVGPGDWIYSYFGHNAIRIFDGIKRSSYNYNFGTFAFPSNFTGVFKFVWEYLQLDLKYSLSRQTMREMIQRYKWQDRNFNMRELLITPKEREKIVEYLRWHYKKENREYLYHHYRANCSTKVRDTLRIAIGNIFWKKAQIKRGATYRKLVLKKVRKNPLLMLGMDFGMGPPADRELTWWEEMFLPEKLEEYVTADFWKELRGHPLASTKARILNKRRAPPQDLPFSPPIFIYLLALSIGLIGFGLLGTPKFTIWLYSSFGLLILPGFGLLFLIFLSEFPTPKGNVNALFFHPFHLIPLISMVRGPRSPLKKRALTIYFYLHLAGIATYLLLRIIKLVPYQENLHYLFLASMVFIISIIEVKKER